MGEGREYGKTKEERSVLPKRGYPLPDGNYGPDSETIVDGTKIKITGILRAEPDLEALARAITTTAERESWNVTVPT